MRDTRIIPLTATVSEKAMLLIDRHALSSGLRLADALIGATALEQDLALFTANVKHFEPIQDLKLERFDPLKR